MDHKGDAVDLWLRLQVDHRRTPFQFGEQVEIIALAQIALGLLGPWPLQIVVDNVLGGEPLPAPLAETVGMLGGDSRLGVLTVAIVAEHRREARRALAQERDVVAALLDSLAEDARLFRQRLAPRERSLRRRPSIRAASGSRSTPFLPCC